jgi:hypothetical protein
MAALLPGVPALDAPFPGLRAFEADEALLFYGRESHVAELLERMGETRFLAVIGTSGSGKSSLVRAGLRPALQRGYLVDATSRWRFALMRPGSAPLDALAVSLADALGGEPVEQIRRSLGATSAGLTQVVARAGLGAGESLLVIADQFEELFRYDITAAQASDASLFVNHLLAAIEQHEVPIYVVVTMRSEFLGRCSEFTGLAEALNRSQYLVPRLTRDERREAIERPLKLFGTTPAPALVQQALNDAGDDPDQLPVLQHVLLRTYRAWQRAGSQGRVEREHYQAIGGIEHALNNHGDEIFNSFAPAQQAVVERLFRSLTVSQGGVALRRPRRLRELYAVADATAEESRQQIDAIISAFASREHSFLMLSSPALTPETVVDITHESLIRKWSRLKGWVREERRSAEWYADLSRDVVRYRGREVGLWKDPELSGIDKRRNDEGWNDAWSSQYRKPDDPPFAEVIAFLGESARAEAAARQAEAEQRDRELRQARALASAKRRQAIALALLLVAVAAVAAVLYRSYRTNQQLAAATADYQQASQRFEAAQTQAQAAQAQMALLQEERERLTNNATGAAATPAERLRLQQLEQQIATSNKDIEAARLQAKGSEDQLAKLRRDQELSASDRGGLLKQIDALKQQLSAAIAERDKLQGSSKGASAGANATQERLAQLQKQLDDERANAARQIATLNTEILTLSGAANAASAASGGALGSSSAGASQQQLTKLFSDGVRAFDLKNYSGAIGSLEGAIKLRGTAAAPKEVRMSGTRFVPFSPSSYLVAALVEAKADCPAIRAALSAAAGEVVPTDVRGQLDAARKQCGP